MVLPVSARAQGKRRRVVILSPINAPEIWDLFRSAMRELGHAEGRDIVLEARSADGKPDLLDRLAAEIVRSRPDVIVASQTPSVVAAKKATSTIPIVMAPAGDPVGTGLVASLARPGGNVTGLGASTAEIAGKLLQLVREVKTDARRVGVLANAQDAFTKPFIAGLQSAASKLRMTLGVEQVRRAEDYEAIFAQWDKLRVQAVVVQPSLARPRAIELALRYRMPAFSPSLTFVEAGGLMSYSSSLKETARKAAVYVDRILKGARPADLPVEQPTVFELAVNLKTAKAIELDIPESLWARADILIQ